MTFCPQRNPRGCFSGINNFAKEHKMTTLFLILLSLTWSEVILMELPVQNNLNTFNLLCFHIILSYVRGADTRCHRQKLETEQVNSTCSWLKGMGKAAGIFWKCLFPWSHSLFRHTLGTPWLSWVGSCSCALLRHDFNWSEHLLHYFSEKKSLRSKVTSVTELTEHTALPFPSKHKSFRHPLRSWHFKHCCFLKDSHCPQYCLTSLLPSRLMGQNRFSAGLWTMPKMGKWSAGQHPGFRLAGQTGGEQDGTGRWAGFLAWWED